MSTDFVVGGLARNEDFCFRSTFIDELWLSLYKENVLLLAPRRTGKTSVMYQLLDDPRHDRLVIHLNVEALTSVGEFFLSLIDAMHDHQPQFVRQYLKDSWGLMKSVFSQIEEVEFLDFKLALRKAEKWDQNWHEPMTQFFDLLRESQKPILFIIDELPDMLTAIQKISTDEMERFLHTFRTLRLDAKSDNIRWLVGGSVNIQSVLSEQGLIKLINDFKTEILPPFTEEEVAQFVGDMLKQRQVPFDDEIIPRIHQLLGTPIPLFLQMLVQEIYRYWRRHGSEKIDIEIVNYVFQHTLLGEAAQDKLHHYYDRVRLYYPQQEQEATYALLDQLSKTESGCSVSALFNSYRQHEQSKPQPRQGHELKRAFKNLLNHLESDFYTHETDNKQYDFGSRLLKAWWRKHYGYDFE